MHKVIGVEGKKDVRKQDFQLFEVVNCTQQIVQKRQ
jgi:hypothetical protein